MNIDPIHHTQEIPQVPTAGAIVGSARRADRTLFAVVGIGVTALLVAAFVVIGAQGSTDAVPVEPAAPIETDDLPAGDQQQPAIVPVDLETENTPEVPAAEPAPVTEPTDEADIDDSEMPAEEGGDAEVEVEPGAEEPADAGDPPAGEPEVNPCVVAADAGQRFFAQDDLILDEGVLGGSIHLTACDPEPIALEFKTVPGVLLSASDMQLQPAGGELFFIIDEAALEDQDVEFKIKITEVDCCAHYVDVSATKTFGLGVMMQFDPGVVFMLEHPDGIDPDDGRAVVDQFVAEHGLQSPALDEG